LQSYDCDFSAKRDITQKRKKASAFMGQNPRTRWLTDELSHRLSTETASRPAIMQETFSTSGRANS
jgi:hypothetical protein